MKQSFLIILFLIFLTTFLNAQPLTKEEALAFAHKLYDVEILSEKGKQDLIQKIQERRLSRKISYNPIVWSNDYTYTLSVGLLIKYCEKIFKKEANFRYQQTTTFYNDSLISESYVKLESHIEYDELRMQYREEILFFNYYNKAKPINDLVHFNRSVFGKNRKRTLDDLLRIGLINPIIYDKMNLSFCQYEHELFKFLFYEIIALEDIEYNQKESENYLERLYNSQLLSEKNYKKVQDLFYKGEIQEQYEILQYFNHSVVVTPEKDSNVLIVYQSIFNTIQELFPDVTFNNLNLIYDDSSSRKDKKGFYLSIEINGVTYHTNQREFNKISQKDFDKIDFIVVINKYLKDIQSNKRLFFTQNPINEFTDESSDFVLLLLTERQRRYIPFYEPYKDLSKF